MRKFRFVLWRTEVLLSLLHRCILNIKLKGDLADYFWKFELSIIPHYLQFYGQKSRLEKKGVFVTRKGKG